MNDLLELDKQIKEAFGDREGFGWTVDIQFEKALEIKALMVKGRWTVAQLMEYLEAMYRPEKMHDPAWIQKVNRVVDYLHFNEILRYEDGFYWND